MLPSNSTASRRRYCSHGLAADAHTALGSMLEVLRGRTRDAWVRGPLGEADVLFLGDHAETPDPTLVAGIRHVVRVGHPGGPRAGSALRLDYPFRVFQLLSLMQEIEEDHASVTVVPTIGSHGSWALFDALQRLAQSTPQGAWWVTRWDDGERLHIRDDLGEFAATTAAANRLREGTLPQGVPGPSPAPAPELPRLDGVELLWRVGLRSGRGQLSGGLDPRHAYRLRVWPDFGRVGADRLHMRLSALLSREALRRDDLARLCGQREDAGVERVNRFLNACAASGLLRAETTTGTMRAAPPAPASAGFVGGLVSRIRQRLGFEPGAATTDR